MTMSPGGPKGFEGMRISCNRGDDVDRHEQHAQEGNDKSLEKIGSTTDDLSSTTQSNLQSNESNLQLNEGQKGEVDDEDVTESDEYKDHVGEEELFFAPSRIGPPRRKVGIRLQQSNNSNASQKRNQHPRFQLQRASSERVFTSSRQTLYVQAEGQEDEDSRSETDEEPDFLSKMHLRQDVLLEDCGEFETSEKSISPNNGKRNDKGNNDNYNNKEPKQQEVEMNTKKPRRISVQTRSANPRRRRGVGLQRTESERNFISTLPATSPTQSTPSTPSGWTTIDLSVQPSFGRSAPPRSNSNRGPQRPALKRAASERTFGSMRRSNAMIASSSDSTSVGDDNNNSTRPQLRKQVSFTKVEFREYGVTLGDHPIPRFGPPVTLAWKPDRAYTVDVELYEDTIAEKRRPHHELRMPADLREELLANRYSEHEYARVKREGKKIRQSRKFAVATEDLDGISLAWEATMKKIKKWTRSGKKKSLEPAEVWLKQHKEKLLLRQKLQQKNSSSGKKGKESKIRRRHSEPTDMAGSAEVARHEAELENLQFD